MHKLNVLLVFGGESSEHDVSIMSAKNVYSAIDKEKYNVSLCYINKTGNDWLNVRSFEDLNGSAMLPILGQKTFTTHDEEMVIDVILPVLHGKNGEDGSIQGLAQLMHVPIVGCGVLGSALCMDKHRTKSLLSHPVRSGIKVANWITFSNEDTLASDLASWLGHDDGRESDLVERIGPAPWFVKPSRAGSSVGVSKVDSSSELEPAIRRAFEHDSTVIVEEAIDGREIEVAVIGNPPYQKASGLGEIIPGDTFYSYDDKYAPDSASQTELSTDLPEKLKQIIRDKACKAYEILNCKGLARVDFFVTSNYEMYLNEVNTFPGFTDISMYPKLWEHEGVAQTELIDRLIAAALE